MPYATMRVSLGKKQPVHSTARLRILLFFHQFWRHALQALTSREARIALAASLTTASVVLAVRQLGTLQPLELAAFDQLVRWSGDRGTDDRLLLVEITEADIRAQKRFPLSDRVIAQMLQQLQQHQPSVIGLDIFRDIPNEPGYQQLVAQLKQPNVIVVNYQGNTREEHIPAPANLPEAQVGFNDIVADPDGIVRRNLMFLGDGESAHTAFSLQLALAYLSKRCRGHCPVSAQITPAGEFQLNQTVFHRLGSNFGGYQGIDAQGYQILLQYRSAHRAVRKVSLQQVLDGQVDPAWIQDKGVLIGITAPSVKDLFYTPYSALAGGDRQMPGVVLHAQMVSQILSTVLDQQPLIWSWSEPLEVLWIVGWALGGGILGARIRHRWVALGLGTLVAVGSLLACGLGAFALAGWIPLAAPALAGGMAEASVLLYRLLRRDAYDALTNLPTRSLFLKQLHKAVPQAVLDPPPQLAVLFLDLDRFKMVNDNLGHHIGDQLLLASRDRLQACLKPRDILARVGGDEFAILLKQIADLSEATAIADQLQQKMAAPFKIGSQKIFISVSIGIVLRPVEPALQPEELLRDAHTAMYQAKAKGKARSEVFVSAMRTQVVRRLQLETELHRALDQQAFQLHYQPIVSLRSGSTIGFEALLRWQHPEHGFISPAEFIPVAEETGLILPLGQWILQTACQQLKHWQTQFPGAAPLMVSVNLSGQQFTQPDLVEFIERTLTATQLAGSSLKLEITESVAMKDVEAAIAMLQRLKALDLQLSIDDFGTGYSSLSYLHRFPADTLKVDRSFVSRMEDAGENAAIVQTIVGLAHSLSMNVVAEGVETVVQLAQLQALGCEYGQGYFFSRPLPPAAAETLLARKTNWLTQSGSP